MRGRRSHRRQGGQALVVIALLSLVVFGFGAIALDQGVGMADRRELQDVADSAALAGAQSGATTNAGHYVALQYVAKNLIFPSGWLSGQGCTSSTVCPAGTYTTGPFTVVLADNGTTSLDVSVKQKRSTLVGGLLGFTSQVVGESARAGTSGSVAGGPCVLCVLDPTASPALSATGNGSVSVTGGSIVVDSSSSTAAKLTGDGSITATSPGVIGIDGNYSTSGQSSFSPTPTTGYPPVPDPLASVPTPSVTGTSQGDYSLSGNGSATINPGIYSSISVTGGGSLTLNPGIYVITGGAMALTGNGSITGSGVLLYFACPSYPTGCTSGQSNGGNLKLTGNGSAVISAPTASTCASIPATCPYEGLLVFYDRNNAAGLSLTGNGSLTGPATTTGTIYAKSTPVTLTGNGGSLDSVVIADTVTLTGNGDLTMSYTASQNYPMTPTESLLR